ncbi:hypothetical protein CJ030_MR2G027148 [Morella rubra]|uniref:Cystatin domain-containing protein n=1 Tax=Morella rubra TaxID=262757 RepID=A0A6A1W8C6_9ROSI|nr:hypothetical protein CJ030_MR2G027148 [Morella rubra]
MDMVKPEEKQMGAEGSGSKDKQMADDDFYNDGLHEMTDEEELFYSSHVLKSDGFDVPAMPDVFSCGMIQPCDVTDEMERIEIGRFAQIAIDEYNRRFEKTKGKLEFVKVLKVMCVVVAGFIFYITFDAKDLADGGTIKTYQSEVFRGIVETSVLSFRLKPPDFEQVKLYIRTRLMAYSYFFFRPSSRFMHSDRMVLAKAPLKWGGDIFLCYFQVEYREEIVKRRDSSGVTCSCNLRSVVLVAGDGPWAARYRNLGENVRVLGPLDQTQLKMFYNAIDIFVNPTLRAQGLDITLLEASLSRKPLMTTRLASITGSVIVSSEIGYTFSPTVTSLKDALYRAWIDGREVWEKKGHAALQRGLKLFTANKMASAYKILFLCISNNICCQCQTPFNSNGSMSLITNSERGLRLLKLNYGCDNAAF